MRTPSIFSSVRKKFVDTFNRSNTTDELGIATDGSFWNIVSGVFRISSNRGASTSAASTYPIASVKMPETSRSTTISVKGAQQGTGTALWITDSGNWWAIGIGQKNVTTCQTCSQCNSFSCAGFSTNCVAWSQNCSSFTQPCNAWNQGNSFCSGDYVGNRFCQSSSCSAWNLRNCNKWGANFTCNGWNASTCSTWKCNAWNTGNCNKFSYNARNCSTWSTNCTGWSTSCNSFSTTCTGGFNICNAWSTFECNCVTTFPPYVRLYRSIATVVSQITESIISSIANSFKVTVSGNQITTKVYSDTNLVTQIGSDLVYTPTGATLTNEYGIIIVPSQTNQGDSVDEISIERD